MNGEKYPSLKIIHTQPSLASQLGSETSPKTK